MDKELNFKLVPHEEQHSDYDWMNIDHNDTRVGKVRGRIDGKFLTIYSMNIFPEFQRHGYAKATIDMFKKYFDTIIADRVRHTAIGFWKRVGFFDRHDGNWEFRSGNSKIETGPGDPSALRPGSGRGHRKMRPEKREDHFR